MDQNRYCIIMAGGIGSRFWPISRRSQPKQFLDILGTGKSFIRHTYERFAKIIPPENFLVATNSIYKPLVLEHLPELKAHQVLCEPVGRNTAPCIAYAAWRLRSVTPADHLILNEEEFRKVISESAEFTERQHAMMTIGIQPSRPDTGYGYIQIDPVPVDGRPAIRKVKTFTEKPNLEMAKIFIESGEFFWNSGIFIWKVGTIMENLNEFLPELQQLFASAEGKYGTPAEQQAIDDIYPACRSISIDFGTWGSLYQHSAKDPEGNVESAPCLFYDTKGCIVKNKEGKLTVIEGLEEYIVVDTDDVLMICPKSNEQNIKKFIDDVKYKIGDKFI